MKTIIARSNMARPDVAEEGATFFNTETGVFYIFRDGVWAVDGAPAPAPAAEEPKAAPTPEKKAKKSAATKKESAKRRTPKK